MRLVSERIGRYKRPDKVPKCLNLSGISQKTAMLPAFNSTNGTTHAIITAMAESARSSSDPDKASSLEQETQTLFSSGASSSTTAVRMASTARSSEMRVRIFRPSLSDRLTQSLITSGLVKGITHTSIRKQSGAAIRASALWPLDGGAADEPKAD